MVSNRDISAYGMTSVIHMSQAYICQPIKGHGSPDHNDSADIQQDLMPIGDFY